MLTAVAIVGCKQAPRRHLAPLSSACCYECLPDSSKIAADTSPNHRITPVSLPSRSEEAEYSSDDTPKGYINMTAVAPDSHFGSQSGTITLTRQEADRLGIKPGVTPSALLVNPDDN